MRFRRAARPAGAPMAGGRQRHAAEIKNILKISEWGPVLQKKIVPLHRFCSGDVTSARKNPYDKPLFNLQSS